MSGATAGALRIAQVVCTDEFAGVERYVVTVSRGLAERGCTVTVLGGEPRRMRAELAGSDVRWVAARTPGQAARRLVRCGGLDLVHAHMTEAELAATLARPLTRAPVVSTRHFAQCRGSSAPARLLGRGLTRAVAGQIAISNFVAGRVEGPSTVVRPGVASRPLADPAAREPVVLLAQRLEPEKRTDAALRIWAASALRERGWTLRIAGDGARRPALQRLAAELGLGSSCVFLGHRPDIARLMSTASVLLATCPDEPFGLSVVEAMAGGLPVVAAAGGGHSETVGLAADAALFRLGDLRAAARLLDGLAADAGRRARYGEQLRAIQRERFTVERQVDQTLDHYRAVLASRPVPQ